MTQLLLPLPIMFQASTPRAAKVAGIMHSPNVARYYMALTAALNIHGLSPSVYAVMNAFATQIQARGFATVIDTAAAIATTRNAIQQHIIGSPCFFDEIALPPEAPYHARRRFTLSQEAIGIMRKVKRETTRRYEQPAPTA